MKTLQDKILESILSRFEKKSEAVNKLSQILNLGRDAVYRRLRGDTVITPDEISIISEEFNLSLDGLIHDDSNLVFFNFNPFQHSISSFDEYLDIIIEDLRVLAENKLYFTSSGSPIFLLGLFPELISFQLYVWGQTVFGFDYLKDLDFNLNIVPPKTIQKYKELTELYLNVPSVEIWGNNILEESLKQIEHYYNSNRFENPSHAFLLLNKYSELLKHFKLMVRKGRKFGMGPHTMESSVSYDLFCNDMIYTKNTMIGQTDNGIGVQLSFGYPNYIKSSDQKVSSYIFEWFENIRTKSVSLNQIDEGQQDIFFSEIQKKIDNLISKLQMEAEMK